MPNYQDDPVVSRNHNVSAPVDGGVYGESSLPNGAGVRGHSKTWNGVYGRSESGGCGLSGEGPIGVAGVGFTWIGVFGETRGTANGPAGVWGEGGPGGVGVKGHSQGAGVPGVAGYSMSGLGPGIFGQGSPAGLFHGDVNITGSLHVDGDCKLPNADCAEEFDLENGPIEPGTVVVLSEQARLLPSAGEYDPRVAGVVSGAGDYRPALTLDARESEGARAPVALMGKVFCLADAGSAPIEVGDMLTTAATPGHAMRASDPARAFGAVIGKALAPLCSGRSLIPVLATLR